MQNDKAFEESEKILRQAQKVINEANRAIEKTESYFRTHDISSEQLIRYLESFGNDEFHKLFQSTLDDVIREARENAGKEVTFSSKPFDSSRKTTRFKKLV
ncbi:MAG: hypothetical protein RLZ92_1887 [Pseudomonadota bacterium]|jgi:hypothetical protein